MSDSWSPGKNNSAVSSSEAAELFDTDDGFRQFCETAGIDVATLAVPASVKQIDIFSTGLSTSRYAVYFPNLTSLTLFNQDITSIEGLDCLFALRTLNLSSNLIAQITGLDNLSCLQALYLHDNHITTASGLSRLTSLTVLWLARNKLRRIEQLCHNKALQELNVASNMLSSIRDVTSRLLDLVSLDISGNDLVDFCDITDAVNAPSLKALHFSSKCYGTNPVTQLSNYRTFAIASFVLPRLPPMAVAPSGRSTGYVLDGVPITFEEVANTTNTVQRKALYYTNRSCLVTGATIAFNVCLFASFASSVAEAMTSTAALDCAARALLRSSISWNPANVPAVELLAMSSTLQSFTTALPVTECPVPGEAAEAGFAASLVAAKAKASIINIARAIGGVALDVTAHTNVLLARLQYELASGGNVRHEDGKPTDKWWQSCEELIKSRFVADDFANYGIDNVAVGHVVRVSNRFARSVFTSRLNILAQEAAASEDMPKPTAKLEYLFASVDPCDPHGYLRSVESSKATSTGDPGRRVGGASLHNDVRGNVLDEGTAASNSFFLAVHRRLTAIARGGATGPCIGSIHADGATCTGACRPLTMRLAVCCANTQYAIGPAPRGRSVSSADFNPSRRALYRAREGDEKQRMWLFSDSSDLYLEYLIDVILLPSEKSAHQPACINIAKRAMALLNNNPRGSALLSCISKCITSPATSTHHAHSTVSIRKQEIDELSMAFPSIAIGIAILETACSSLISSTAATTAHLTRLTTVNVTVGGTMALQVGAAQVPVSRLEEPFNVYVTQPGSDDVNVARRRGSASSRSIPTLTLELVGSLHGTASAVNLTHVFLTGCSISCIPSVISQLTSCVHLDLSHNCILSIGASPESSPLPSSLTSLDLSYNLIDDAGMLPPLLISSTPSLVQLSLAANALVDPVVVSGAIGHCVPKLKKLDLTLNVASFFSVVLSPQGNDGSAPPAVSYTKCVRSRIVTLTFLDGAKLDGALETVGAPACGFCGGICVPILPLTAAPITAYGCAPYRITRWAGSSPDSILRHTILTHQSPIGMLPASIASRTPFRCSNSIFPVIIPKLTEVLLPFELLPIIAARGIGVIFCQARMSPPRMLSSCTLPTICARTGPFVLSIADVRSAHRQCAFDVATSNAFFSKLPPSEIELLTRSSVVNLGGLRIRDETMFLVASMLAFSCVEVLSLEHNRLESLNGDAWVSQLVQTPISEVTSALGSSLPFAHLKSLIVRFNTISSLSNFHVFKNLKLLNLSWNRLDSLEGLQSNASQWPMPLLSTLIVDGNNLTSLRGISAAPALLELHAAYNHLSALDPVVKHLRQCSQLIVVDLSGNSVKSVPHYRMELVFACPRLRVLDGSSVSAQESTSARSALEGRLTPELIASVLKASLDDSTALRNATSLAIQSMSLKSLSSLDILPNLRVIRAENNQITDCSSLGSPPTCANLCFLNLSGNPLCPTSSKAEAEQLGKILSACAKLQTLVLDSTGITSLNHLNLQLKSLTCLHVAQNAITILDGLRVLPALKELNLCHNKVRSLDRASLLCVPSLGKLYLDHNAIRNIDAFAECADTPHLQLLTDLTLTSNRIVDMSELGHIAHITSLTSLSLAGNAVCRSSLYRATLLARHRDLKILDARVPTDAEREQAIALFLNAEAQQSALAAQVANQTASSIGRIDRRELAPARVKTIESPTDGTRIVDGFQSPSSIPSTSATTPSLPIPVRSVVPTPRAMASVRAALAQPSHF